MGNLRILTGGIVPVYEMNNKEVGEGKISSEIGNGEID